MKYIFAVLALAATYQAGNLAIAYETTGFGLHPLAAFVLQVVSWLPLLLWLHKPPKIEEIQDL